MEIPISLQYGHVTDPFYLEYVQRKGHFDMPNDHFHPFYEIYYLLSGQRIYFVKDSFYPLQQGDLVFIPKHELHKTLHLGEQSHERIVIHFDDRFVLTAFGQQSDFLLSPFQQSTHVLRLPSAEQSVIHAHIRRTITELQHKPTGYELYLSQAITDLLLISARYLQKHGSVSISYTTPMHKKMVEIVRYLNINYAEPITLTMISKQFFISPHYLSRVFKKVTGFSLIDCLNLTRVMEAQKLLRESDMKIIDVAAKVGFENFSHFGKIFKKITRIPARAYRKRDKHWNG